MWILIFNRVPLSNGQYAVASPMDEGCLCSRGGGNRGGESWPKEDRFVEVWPAAQNETQELKNINKLLFKNKTPFTAILGGAKVSDKIGVIEKLVKVVDNIIIGGAMANTFIKSQGGEIGNSIYEKDKLIIADNLLKKAKEKNVNIFLPLDYVCSISINEIKRVKTYDSYNIPDNLSGYDIGEKSIKIYTNIILESKTIIWNGPMGVFEINRFSNGTHKISEAICSSTKNGAYSLVGGGDSVAAINKNNYSNNISFISTGGGALLELLAKGTLSSLKLL